MAPVRSKNRGSDGASTPTKQRRRMALTQGQKQVLIDNLQLEVTSRARKLRAQYALQAQGLRTRVEIRVNRIPLALRKVNMGDLIAKYAAGPEMDTQPDVKVLAMPKNGATAASMKQLVTTTPALNNRPTQHPRGIKRPSNDLDHETYKENTPQPELQIPKKRAKTTMASTAATRATSRTKAPQAQILSPKSSNPRSVPHSPVPGPGSGHAVTSPSKAASSRTGSPLKAAPSTTSQATTATSRTTRAIAGMVERAKSTRAKAARKISPATKATPATTAAASAPTTASAATSRATSTTAGSMKSKTLASASVPDPVPSKRKATGPARKAEPAKPAPTRRVLRKRT